MRNAREGWPFYRASELLANCRCVVSRIDATTITPRLA